MKNCEPLVFRPGKDLPEALGIDSSYVFIYLPVQCVGQLLDSQPLLAMLTTPACEQGIAPSRKCHHFDAPVLLAWVCLLEKSSSLKVPP